MLLGTRKCPNLQYGTVASAKFGSRTVCHLQKFTTKMSLVPAIKLTAHVTSRLEYRLLANVWLRNVTDISFEMCYREVLAFSGSRNITINYIALAITQTFNSTNATNSFTEHGTKLFQGKLNQFQSNEAKFCEWMSLKFIYQFIPNIFVTPEEGAGGTGGELVAWVKSVSKRRVEICAKNSKDSLTHRVKPIKVHYQVQGKLHPCSFHKCPSHLECQAVNLKQPYCTCISSCPRSSKLFCGTDYVTYQSMCHLYQSHCRSHGNNSMTNVTIAHHGKCQSKSICNNIWNFLFLGKYIYMYMAKTYL